MLSSQIPAELNLVAQSVDIRLDEELAQEAQYFA